MAYANAFERLISLRGCIRFPYSLHRRDRYIQATLFVCLFVRVLGRDEYYGHYATITYVKNLLRGVYHREFNVENIGENGTSLDPG